MTNWMTLRLRGLGPQKTAPKEWAGRVKRGLPACEGVISSIQFMFSTDQHGKVDDLIENERVSHRHFTK